MSGVEVVRQSSLFWLPFRPSVRRTAVAVLLSAVLLGAEEAPAWASATECDERILLATWEASMIAVVGSGLNESEFDALEAAVLQWNAQGCQAPILMLTDASLVGESHAEIAWSDEWNELALPNDAPANTTIQYLVSSERAEIGGAQILLNPTYDFSSIDLERVFLHELGHVLGLEHPCGLEASSCEEPCSKKSIGKGVMHPDYHSQTASISSEDFAQLCESYSSRSSYESFGGRAGADTETTESDARIPSAGCQYQARSSVNFCWLLLAFALVVRWRLSKYQE